MSNRLRIIFMGTPEFAVSSLQALVEASCEVVAVVTAPDKPAGRGLKVSMSPVKEYALQQNIPVLQPEKLKNKGFLEELKSYRADLQVVVAFRMLPEVVWNMPPLGTFNLHASLLPQYRGAAPINWAVINGETESGVTTFFLQHEIDTGQIIFQEKVAVGYHDTAGTLYDNLMKTGAELVVKTVAAIQEGNYQTTLQQEQSDLKSAPKIFRETCEINWDKPAEQVRNLIRGLAPYPAAWTTINGKSAKIFKSSVTGDIDDASAGTIATDNKKYIHVKTADRWLAIEEIQIEGKKKMAVEELLRGFKPEKIQ
jgi:methionyl-tRNA formyltransferase